MKKIFIVLSALAALMLCVVPAQALVGSPDDVPGEDAIVPFICDRSLTSGLNTLIVFADVVGGWNSGGTLSAPAAIFHYNIVTVASVSVDDGWIKDTPHGMASTNAFELMGVASATAKTALEVTFAGADYYAGYLYFDAQHVGGEDYNSTVGQFFFVNLAAGKAAAANIPMREYALAGATTNGAANVHVNMIAEMVEQGAGLENEDTEFFSANALANAKVLPDW